MDLQRLASMFYVWETVNLMPADLSAPAQGLPNSRAIERSEYKSRLDWKLDSFSLCE